MFYDTIEEYNEEIQIVKDAIRRIIQSGQRRDIESGDNSRSTEEAKLESLKRHLKELKSEKRLLEQGVTSPSRMVNLGAKW